jgi:hypothetical protein
MKLIVFIKTSLFLFIEMNKLSITATLESEMITSSLNCRIDFATEPAVLKPVTFSSPRSHCSCAGPSASLVKYCPKM